MLKLSPSLWQFVLRVGPEDEEECFRDVVEESEKDEEKEGEEEEKGEEEGVAEDEDGDDFEAEKRGVGVTTTAAGWFRLFELFVIIFVNHSFHFGVSLVLCR